jgi:hypothetical protein
VAVIVPLPDAAKLAPDPTNIAAAVFVALVKAEKEVAAVADAVTRIFPALGLVRVMFVPASKLIVPDEVSGVPLT